jgi:secreted trypsin-like serine protease
MKIAIVLCSVMAAALAAPPQYEVVHVQAPLESEVVNAQTRIPILNAQTRIPILDGDKIPVELLSSLDLPNEIVGGQNAAPHEFPFMVHLKSFLGTDGSYSQCGGSILSSKHILTAAHCVYFDNLRYIQVIAGDYNRDRTDDAVTQDRWAVKITYAGYNPTTLVNDIAILELQYDLTWSNTVSQACLASGSDTYAGWQGTVIGWGRTSQGGTASSILQKLNMEILSTAECNQLGGGSTDKQICVIDRINSKGVCQGDSGGPLVVNQNGRLRQAGIASYITANCGTANAPSVYVRVTAYRSFIQGAISPATLLSC